MDEREAANRAVAEHVARLRAAIEQGKTEIDRQQAAVSDTRAHLTDIQRWLAEQRGGFDDAA